MDGRGRPRKAVCKSETIHMRVTAQEKQDLLKRANELQLSLAELILRHCLPMKASSPSGQQLNVFAQPPLDTLAIRFPKKTVKKAFTVSVDKKSPSQEG